MPKAGETLHGHKFQTGFGGKGANQCVAAARQGSKTALIAKLGADTFGSDYLCQLRAENVNVEHVQQLDGQTTGIAQIAVSDGGENNIIIVVGANNLLNASDVRAAAEHFAKSKVLVCQLETPIEATMEALRQFSGISILNAAPALKQTPTELLKLSSILCVNETEAALMTDVKSIDTIRYIQINIYMNLYILIDYLPYSEANAALTRLIELGANTVIITLGKLGAVYASKDASRDYELVPAPIVPSELVLDTTGAGDAFIGALANSLARYPDLTLADHIAAACEVASKSVQQLGTQSSFPHA